MLHSMGLPNAKKFWEILILIILDTKHKTGFVSLKNEIWMFALKTFFNQADKLTYEVELMFVP